MDNKTHMLFHDMDIEEVTRKKVQKQTQKEYFKVIKEIFRCQAAGMTREQIIEQLKRQFAFSNKDIEKLLP